MHRSAVRASSVGRSGVGAAVRFADERPAHDADSRSSALAAWLAEFLGSRGPPAGSWQPGCRPPNDRWPYGSHSGAGRRAGARASPRTSLCVPTRCARARSQRARCRGHRNAPLACPPPTARAAVVRVGPAGPQRPRRARGLARGASGWVIVQSTVRAPRARAAGRRLRGAAPRIAVALLTKRSSAHGTTPLPLRRRAGARGRRVKNGSSSASPRGGPCSCGPMEARA